MEITKNGIIYFLFGVLIITFIILKFPHLSLPYFWDEAWVYGPALVTMYQNGVSILPDALPIDYSRGHPLLFHFLGGSWQILFGSSLFSLHSFALFISILLLVATFFVGKKVFSMEVGLAASFLLFCQPLFLEQSSAVLPEVLLTLLCLTTIYFYLKNKWILYIISGSLLLLTKESGIVVIGCIFIWHWIEKFIFHKNDIKPVIKDSFILILPIVIASAHFIVQFFMFGWFFYPEHIDLIQFSYQTFQEKFQIGFSFVFKEEGRLYFFLSIPILFVILYKDLKVWQKTLIIGLIFSFTKVLFNFWKLPAPFLFILISITLLFIIFTLGKKIYTSNEEQGRFFNITLLVLSFFLIFSSLNFFTIRYLLILFPLILISGAFFIFAIPLKPAPLKFLIVIPFLIFSFSHVYDFNKPGEIKIPVVDVLKVEQDLVNFLEEEEFYQEKISAPFNINIALTNKLAGFLSSEKIFHEISGDLESENSKYFIINNFEMTESDLLKFNFKGKTRIKRFEHGKYWAEILILDSFEVDSSDFK